MTDRLSALRVLLEEGSLSTQEELREKLEKQHFNVTQSTISRDLRKLNAIRANDGEGRVVYRLPDQEVPVAGDVSRNMVRSVEPAAGFAVIYTSPGTASLVARHLDFHRPAGLVGTIAGDDTVFLALPKPIDKNSMAEIRESLAELD
jgi:transcriptional regulator of arginine metabolism